MRMRIGATLVLAAAVALGSQAARADDLRGAERLLCTAVQVNLCSDDGDCFAEAPWNLNVPQFIEVDLAAKRLSTTKASGENRSTPIDNLKRDGGAIVIQGFERGRAFSLLIDEESGMMTAAVARNGVAVSVFGACTPGK